MELLASISSTSSSAEDDGDSAWQISGYVLLFLAVIYLLCHTADNYFSPVLAAICDLMDMPPEVAGVTFLAFGNGAPDVFSSLVALTSSSTDRESALLVGIGSLLGATIMTVTIIVGSVAHIRPTDVPPVAFSRDVVFLLLALLLVLASSMWGGITLWLAFCYLGLYVVYVAFVFRGPGAGVKTKKKPLAGSRGSPNSSEGVEVLGLGGEDGGGSAHGSCDDDFGFDARWIPDEPPSLPAPPPAAIEDDGKREKEAIEYARKGESRGSEPRVPDHCPLPTASITTADATRNSDSAGGKGNGSAASAPQNGSLGLNGNASGGGAGGGRGGSSAGGGSGVRDSFASGGGPVNGSICCSGSSVSSINNSQVKHNYFRTRHGGDGSSEGGEEGGRGNGDLNNDDEEEEEENSLLGKGGVHRKGKDWMGGDVLARIPGSTVSMFLEEDDSAANWLAQRRWGGRGSVRWGLAAPGAYDSVNNSRNSSGSGYGSRELMREPLLTEERQEEGSRDFPGASGALSVEDGGVMFDTYSSENLFGRRRFEHAWASLQWKQWRMRRRLHRQFGNSNILQLPLYRQVFYALELPFILVRNATIPPVEQDSWSQAQAALSTALAPLLLVWAFGIWNTGFLGMSSRFLSWGLVAALAGIPVGIAVWLTTHKRRMPSDRWYRLSLALVAFASCVAWIYYLADLAVGLIEDIGDATGISSSVLGLTFLAWGNSSGDLVTNLAVAKAGYPGMAIAGSYGGPLFNVLLGIGLPMVWNCVSQYPTPSKFELDSATRFTAWMAALVLICTLPAIAWSGFRFPAKAPLALLGVYVVYVVGAVVLTLTGV